MFWNQIFPIKLTKKEEPFWKKDILLLWVKILVACVPAAIVGVLFDDTIDAVDVKHGAFDRKLLITAIGGHTIRMVPPLIASREDCDKAYAILEETVKALSK